MKRLLFLICFVFAFVLISKADPVKEKKHFAKESPKAKSKSEVAILAQNQMLFAKFRFGKPTDHYLGYVVRYKKERFYIPIIPGKPCKIPIPLKTRNKDNI